MSLGPSTAQQQCMETRRWLALAVQKCPSDLQRRNTCKEGAFNPALPPVIIFVFIIPTCSGPSALAHSFIQ